MQKCIENGRNFNIALGLKSSTLTQGLKYSLATGNWGDQTRAMQSRAGVAQVLNRYNYLATLSHLRRVNTPIEKDGKLAKPRQLHNTHWGMVCPAETPEGHACGLSKNLSLMAYISVGKPAGPIIEVLEECGVERLEEIMSIKGTKVFVNGAWIGVHSEPYELISVLRALRRSQQIDIEVSLIYDVRDNEIRINCDAGRPCRPVFVVRGGKLLITKEDIKGLKDVRMRWDDLVETGKVEFLDADEEEVSLIAVSPSA
ncbi:DNA-directed RNA polymerase II subunit RPB2, partial [Pancytospora epiphaga]